MMPDVLMNGFVISAHCWELLGSADAFVSVKWQLSASSVLKPFGVIHLNSELAYMQNLGHMYAATIATAVHHSSPP